MVVYIVDLDPTWMREPSFRTSGEEEAERPGGRGFTRRKRGGERCIAIEGGSGIISDPT